MTKQTYAMGVLLAFCSLLILGAMPVISNSRPVEFHALSFALFLSFWQLLLSIPPMFLEWKYRTKGIFSNALSTDIRKKSVGIILLTGVIFGLSTFVYVLSVEKVGATNAAIAITAYPVFAILWETIFFQKKKTALEILITVVMIITLFYLGTGGSWAIEGISIWFVMALGVPFLWSIAHVIIKDVIDKTPITPLQVTYLRVLVSATFIFIISLFVFGPSKLVDDFFTQSYQQYAFIMGLVYYVELVVWFYAVRSIDVSLASSITTPWPALTMALAVLFLGDKVEGYQIISLVLVAICVYLLLYLGSRNRF